MPDGLTAHVGATGGCPGRPPDAPTDAETILSGPDYFDCERFSCRLSREVCVDRQTKKIRITSNNPDADNAYLCSDCPQGAKIAREMGVKLPRTQRKACRMPDCMKPVRSRGLCGQHYDEWYAGKLDDDLGPFFRVRFLNREPERHTLNRFYSGGKWE